MLALPPLRRPRAIARLLLREKPQRAIDHRLGRSIHDHGVGGGRSGVFSADGRNGECQHGEGREVKGRTHDAAGA